MFFKKTQLFSPQVTADVLKDLGDQSMSAIIWALSFFLCFVFFSKRLIIKKSIYALNHNAYIYFIL